MEELVALCKRRGFIFQSSEIYGGLQGVYDFGPLGVELKNNLKNAWWKAMVYENDDIEGLDASILTNPLVLDYSGHTDTFSDPMVDCKSCGLRFRADQVPKSCKKEDLTEPRQFNLMFKTNVGPVEESGTEAFLRPETAQGIYVNYLLVQGAMRLKIPFGIAQIGKAFRNEIIARNFIFRTREFEQMEMQYFVKPDADNDAMNEWKENRFQFYTNHLGVTKSKLRFHKHGDGELAHYAKEAWDIEYEFPFGWSEIEGVHNRTDYDLLRHEEFSGKKLSYFDQVNNERYLPYIIETSAGLNRMLLTVLADSYWEDKENNRIVMKLHPRLAPIKAVVCPLTKKDGLPEKARSIMDMLKNDFKIIYDQQGSIGKRYYRQDEAGTPFGITVDHQSIQDDTVTIRYRDTQKQDRLSIAEIKPLISNSINTI